MSRRSDLALEVVVTLILRVDIELYTPILMKLLAIRLGCQKTPAKSLVIAFPLEGGRD